MIPIKDNIIIKPEKYVTTSSGLYIKATEMDGLRAVVIAVGKGTKKNPMSIQVGQTVLYRKDVGIVMDYMGEEVLLIKESQVIAIT